MANMVQMMQKASLMKKKMQEMQERARSAEVEGSAASGLVSCKMTGGFEMKSIKIDPSLAVADDVEALEDMIVAAVNNARVKAEKMMSEETQKIMAELGLPGGLPF